MAQPKPKRSPTRADLELSVQRARKAAASLSLTAFCRLYLPSHFSLPASLMHKEITALLEAASQSRGARLAIAAPRGYAKSTLVSIAYVLWSVIRGTEPYILLISNTADQAAQLLTDVKRELEENPFLLRDFPEVAEPSGRRPSPKRWREREIRTRNHVLITALGAGQKVRGRKHGKDRPSLILLDDIEGDQDARSADLRESRRDWFERAVLKAGVTGSTNVMVVGTILHYDSILGRLVGIGRSGQQPGWTSHRYQAILSWASDQGLWERWENLYIGKVEIEGRAGPAAAQEYYESLQAEMLEGASVLWPERESYRALMELRLTEGRASFDSEKMNEPIDQTTCLFDPDRFLYWDDPYGTEVELLDALGSRAIVYGACDPSLGKRSRDRDNTAIITLVKDRKTGKRYVLGAVIQKLKPSVIIDSIEDLHRSYGYSRFAMETNQFQELLADQLRSRCRDAGIGLNLVNIHHSQDKVARIQGLEALIATGQILFSRKHRALLDELRQFPRGAHDDGPDALEMAVEISQYSGLNKIIFG